MRRMNNRGAAFLNGMQDGIPIALGYFAVSFSLGIAARNVGLSPAQGFLASALCNASAGEYALFTLIGAKAALWEIALVTLITDYIVYGTLATAIGVPIALGIMDKRPILALIIFIATAVMVYKHRENFKRLREGTEIGLMRANKGKDRVN